MPSSWAWNRSSTSVHCDLSSFAIFSSCSFQPWYLVKVHGLLALQTLFSNLEFRLIICCFWTLFIDLTHFFPGQYCISAGSFDFHDHWCRSLDLCLEMTTRKHKRMWIMTEICDLMSIFFFSGIIRLWDVNDIRGKRKYGSVQSRQWYPKDQLGYHDRALPSWTVDRAMTHRFKTGAARAWNRLHPFSATRPQGFCSQSFSIPIRRLHEHSFRFGQHVWGSVMLVCLVRTSNTKALAKTPDCQFSSKSRASRVALVNKIYSSQGYCRLDLV